MSKNGAADALKTFELENNIQTIDHDQLFKYDPQQYQQFLQSKPWSKEYL